jgi:hypothetical protein
MPASCAAGGGVPVFEYRITKYDPAFRDARGAYRRDDWTAVTDIGSSFGGVVLTRDVYRRVEDAYVTAALGFLREVEVSVLTVEGLENRAGPAPVVQGGALGLAEAAEVIRRVLRDDFWCRLEGPEAFVHFGYDYYMYVGVARACPEAEQLARRVGLFVEPFLSPYHDRRRDPLHIQSD